MAHFCLLDAQSAMPLTPERGMPAVRIALRGVRRFVWDVWDDEKRKQRTAEDIEQTQYALRRTNGKYNQP